MTPSGQKWDGAGKWGSPADRKAGGAGDGIRHHGIKRSEPPQKCVPPAGPEAVEQGAQFERGLFYVCLSFEIKGTVTRTFIKISSIPNII